MTSINSYRDLLVWQKSIILVTEVYTISQSFPIQEMYGLTNEMRQSAVSIPGNIAEGYGRHSTGDYKRFLQIAIGLLFELQTQVEVDCNLNYLAHDKFNNVSNNTKELDRMLLSLIKKIN